MKIATLILLLTTTCAAQSFPHWPANTHVKVYLFHGAFKPKEQKRIQAAIDSWSFPSGITMEIVGETESTVNCTGCMTVNREDCRKGEWGDIQATHFNGLILFAVVSLDRRGGDGKALQRLMAHETGHSLGLGDSNATGSIMSNQWVSGGDPRPTAQDVEWVRLVYAGGQRNGDVRLATTDTVDVDRHMAATSDLVLQVEMDGVRLWQAEQATREAFKQHSCRRTILIQTLDANGNVTGEYRRVSLIVLGDDGRRLEKVLSNPKSTLKGLKITKADLEDFSNGQMFGPDIAHSELYQFYDQGNEIAVKADATKGVRVFQGSLVLDDKGRIVKVSGRTYPEGKERFPLFTATRSQVGDYLFPSKVEANDTLHFTHSNVRVRWIIEFTDYKKFSTSSNVTEAAQ